MILQISTRDDESTLLPDERRRGDVFAVYPDTFIPATIERATWFFPKLPDPPLLSKWQSQLVLPRYGNPPTDNEPRPVILFREWKLEYWLFLPENEVGIIDNGSDADPNTPGYQAEEGVNYLATGPLGTGNVTEGGVLEGVFTVNHLKYK